MSGEVVRVTSEPGELLLYPSGNLACGWFWDDPADNEREHICVRKPGHGGRHVCWCGGDLVLPCEVCGSPRHWAPNPHKPRGRKGAA